MHNPYLPYLQYSGHFLLPLLLQYFKEDNIEKTTCCQALEHNESSTAMIQRSNDDMTYYYYRTSLRTSPDCLRAMPTPTPTGEMPQNTVM